MKRVKLTATPWKPERTSFLRESRCLTIEVASIHLVDEESQVDRHALDQLPQGVEMSDDRGGLSGQAPIAMVLARPLIKASVIQHRD